MNIAVLKRYLAILDEVIAKSPVSLSFRSFTRSLLEDSSKPDIIETTLRVEFLTVRERSDKPNIVETILLG